MMSLMILKLPLQIYKKKIDDGEVLYNHFADKSSKKKWEYNYKLKVINDSFLPNYLVKNRINFNEWFK